VPYRHRAKVTSALPGLVVVLVTAITAPAAATPGPSGPAHAPAGASHGDPHLTHRIHSVDAALARLSRHGEHLDEQYDVAAAAVTTAQQSARQARQAAQLAAAQYQAAHQRFVAAMTQQYEGGTSPSIGALLSSSTPQNYLDSLSITDYLAKQFAATVDAEQAAHQRAGQAAAQAATAAAAAKAKQATLATRRTALKQQTQRVRALLDTLTARQRRERAHARAVAAAKARAALSVPQPSVGGPAQSAPTPGPSGPVSGDVARVVAFAEAQVGKSYGYAASGPDSYDCSGLTMAAWAQAGVQLPHSAAGQYDYGTHVSYNQLEPGDLIFLYSPIGHVELYVGHDLAVSAADPAEGVVYVHPSDDMGDYVGATRLSG
jgi:cell wall-associated NlpC family hydrolase